MDDPTPSAPSSPPGDRARSPITRRDVAIHLGLFVATCATTILSSGVVFAATLMTILVCHEMGHYWMARRHQLDVSLPYFIPLPPMISLGTLGAVIKMRAPIRRRDALIDVGAAGPIAGMVVAIPALIIGLSLSEVGPLPPDSVLEGNSILYGLIKLAMFGRWLPSEGIDVQLHPMAFAAWVGMLVTMINLIPIGQLDGGHVMRAWLGDKHERISGVLHRALIAVALAIGAGLYSLALGSDRDELDAVAYALGAVSPWLVWSVALVVMRRMGGGQYHPPVFGPPLSPGRRWLAVAMVVVFLVVFVPVPMRPAL